MNELRRPPRNLGKLVVGLAILSFGVLLTLDELNVVDSGDYFRWWPGLLVVFGLAKLLQPGDGGGRMFGFIVGIVGTLMLLKNVGMIHWGIWDLWPLILVLIGGSIAWEALFRGPGGRHGRRMRHRPFVDVRVHRDDPDNLSPPSGGSTPSGFSTSGFSAGTSAKEDPLAANGERAHGRGSDLGSTIDSFTFLGGNQPYSTSQDFRGGTITAVLGGCEVDLRQASIATGPAHLDLKVYFGGVEIRVPPDWLVINHVGAVLGGVEVSAVRPIDDRKTLIIRGTVAFGGVEVKN